MAQTLPDVAMTQRARFGFGQAFLAALSLGICASCASLPKNEYGIDEIRWRGLEQMSSQSLESCLASKERERVTLRLGLGGTSCGKPPFDESTPELRLWTWPWSTWPLYDPAIFDIDRKRIVRWFQARGFYHAKVVGVQYSAGGKQLQSAERCTGPDCELTIQVEVTEGEPIRVKSIVVTGDRGLDMKVRIELREAPEIKVGERFDEANYEADKQALEAILREHSFAQAKVQGKVELDRNQRIARVEYTVQPGPFSTFGTMRVEGNAGINPDAIMEVAGIKPGARFKPSTISDAERAVHALGVFSSVRIDTKPRAGGGIVDLVIRVSLGRLERWRLGIGMLSGTMQRGTSDETFSIPEWDIHLRAAYSHEDFLGGMRKLRLEERPRLIMLDAFPFIPSVGPQLGNTISAAFEQPRFVEPRTVFFLDGQWDYGPAPFLTTCDMATAGTSDARPECVVFRHDLQTKTGLRRKFFDQRVSVQLAVAHDLYELVGTPSENVSSYRLPYLEQQVRLDLRNDPQRPSKGIYIDILLQEALRPFGYGSWNYIRWLPEARAYQRLMWRMVLAERFAFGALFIDEAGSDQSLDEMSLRVGPESYRLRGGGANSNRGFSAGRLGVGINGGNRRWEASIELRIPLGENVGMALFFDAGDVNDQRTIRWHRLNASTGLGFRYYTPFAPIRFDAGWRIPGLQGLGSERTPECPPSPAPQPAGGCDPKPDANLKPLSPAMHLTIGEAF